MPDDWRWAYTRCGLIATEEFYVDDTMDGAGLHVKYERRQIDALIKDAEELASQSMLVMHMFNVNRVDMFADLPNPASIGHRGWLAAAIKKHSNLVKGKNVVVFGSQQPMCVFGCHRRAVPLVMPHLPSPQS
jgi:hypothetical protein